uniref:Uncharacterized protein n=1 Tax=Solanum tuberosum TaxID=4113 RepID=M1DXL0_SOLTU
MSISQRPPKGTPLKLLPRGTGLSRSSHRIMRYNEEIVRDLYPSYASTITKASQPRAKLLDQSPLLSTMVRDLFYDISESTIYHFIYGLSHAQPINTAEYDYRMGIVTPNRGSHYYVGLPDILLKREKAPSGGRTKSYNAVGTSNGKCLDDAEFEVLSNEEVQYFGNQVGNSHNNYQRKLFLAREGSSVNRRERPPHLLEKTHGLEYPPIRRGYLTPPNPFGNRKVGENITLDAFIFLFRIIRFGRLVLAHQNQLGGSPSFN